MVRTFIVFSFFVLLGCTNNNKQAPLNMEQVPLQVKYDAYRVFEEWDSLKAAFPDLAEGVNYKKIELEWFSLPPNDTVFVGLHGKDTLVKKIWLNVDSSERIEIGNKIITMEHLKTKPRFKGAGNILLGNFPGVYSYQNSYILECSVAGCNGSACIAFYIMVDKY